MTPKLGWVTNQRFCCSGDIGSGTTISRSPCLPWWKFLCSWARPTILRPMDKLSEWINALICTYVVEFMILQSNGSLGSLSQNSGITQTFIFLWAILLCKNSMDTLLPWEPTSLKQEQDPAVEFLKDRDDQLAKLKQHLTASQNRMMLQADHHLSDKKFQVREKVLLKLQLYVQQ